MNKKEIIDNILAYQEAKNKFILEETDMELIPDIVKLTKEDLDNEDIIDHLYEMFESSSKLNTTNCIHCLIDSYKCITVDKIGCVGCKYATKLDGGSYCRDMDSLFAEVFKLYKHTENNKLKQIGDELIIGFKEYYTRLP